MRFHKYLILLLFSWVFLASGNAFASGWGGLKIDDAPPTSADAGASFDISARSDYSGGACSQRARLTKQSGSCTLPNSPINASNGAACSDVTASGTVTMDSSPTAACVIEFWANAASNDSQADPKTIKINQYLEWDSSLPSNNFVGPSTTIQAVSRYKQSGGADTGRAVTYESTYETVCSFEGAKTTSSVDAVTITVEGSGDCEITAKEAGDANFMFVTPLPEHTHSFTIIDSDGDGVSDADELDNGTDPDIGDQVSIKDKLTITPRYYLFAQEELNAASCETSSTAVRYVITNTDAATHSLTSAPAVTTGINADEFAVSSTGSCSSGLTLAPGASCDFEVVYCPTSNGNKSAVVSVESDIVIGTSGDAHKVSSALFSYEDAKDEAKRRVPPLLTNVIISYGAEGVLSEPVLSVGTDYTFTLEMQGYSDSYKVLAVFFKCDAAQRPRCGKYYYENNFLETGWLTGAFSTGDIKYEMVAANKGTYSFTYTPSTENIGEVVMRVYQISDEDISAGHKSISLLAPGNLILPAFEYGQGGRRLQFTVQ